MAWNEYEAAEPIDKTVIVIGAGVAGVALAVNLAKRGICDFTVLEMSEGIGGTWWDNRYPGAEVDVTSELYSFSFAPHVFTRTHAGQAEVQRYIEDVVAERGLADHFTFGTKVEGVEWVDETSTYLVTAADGRRWRTRFLVSCVGQLNNPSFPTWPGMDRFTGEMFHTSRWDDAVSLAGKRVAVVGTGSTSAQVVPEIATIAEHVHLFQRQPGWVVPKDDRDYPEAERIKLARSSVRQRLRRLTAFQRLEAMRSVARAGTKSNRRMQAIAEQYLIDAVPDDQLRAQLTPDYPFFGKRPVLTKYFYPALARDNVTLVPRPVTALTDSAVVDESGSMTDVDIIVLATGFQPSRFLATYEMSGRGGVLMRDTWDDEPRSFLGLMAEGFPNFFVTYGPNTNGGTLTFTLERQAEWISDAIRSANRSRSTVDVKSSAVDIVDRIVQRRNADFVWSSTHNYYTSATGRVVTQWPFTQKFYWLLLKSLRPGVVCRRTAANWPKRQIRTTSHTGPSRAESDSTNATSARTFVGRQ